ncbi:C6 transcription factor [Xylogone sp. PMI_703]|nr:C6 transcription factor [Xylogone sp. PMI_703]
MASQQSSNSTQAYKQTEPKRRRRIALACSACRVRKSRCDGRQPSCSTCMTLALECLYEPSDSSTNVLVRKEYVSGLEQRLRHVERALQRQDDLLTRHFAACSSTIEACSIRSSNGHSSFSKTDGFAIVFVDEQTPAFYGESPNIVFIRYLLRAMSVVSKVKQHGMVPSCKENGFVEGISAPLSQQLSPSTLPPPEEMDVLLSAYFSSYGALFPFLHEPTFRETYEECKATGFAKVRRTWLGLLNMIFAMASNVDQSAGVPAKERFKKSHIFSESLMRTVSLDIVQYLLLVVLYLQGTQRSIQTWSAHGILVRTAMALGLYSEQSGQGLDPIQREIRRRTWLTIYCLDKLLSVTFGRPPSILDEYIVVQLPSPWTYPTDMSNCQLNDVDINTEFLNATYGMNLRVTNDELDMDESTPIQTASAMRQELRRCVGTWGAYPLVLTRWDSNVPPNMGLCEPGSEILSKNTESNRLRVILTLRYHFVSILFHRLLLCAALPYWTIKEPSAESALSLRIQLAMAEAHECIRSAENTIEIVHTVPGAQKTGRLNLGIWFFTLFYVFNASLIILSRSVLSQHGIYASLGSNSSSIRSFLTRAVESLKKLDKDNRLVCNCANFIRHLSERQSSQV